MRRYATLFLGIFLACMSLNVSSIMLELHNTKLVLQLGFNISIRLYYSIHYDGQSLSIAYFPTFLCHYLFSSVYWFFCVCSEVSSLH